MSKDQIRAEIQLKLADLLDSFVVVGTMAGGDEVVIAANVEDAIGQSRIVLGMVNLLDSNALTPKSK